VWNGDTHPHHIGNVANALQNLLEMGLDLEHIYIASEGPNPDRRLPRSHFGVADFQNLRFQLNLLRGQMARGSTLILYITGHGGPGKPGTPADTFAALHRSYQVRAGEVETTLSHDLPLGRLILVIDACYSGGFVKTLEQVGARYAGMSPTDEYTPTYCQPFAYLFWDDLADTSLEKIRACFETTLNGCEDYRRRGTCEHAPFGCPSYRKKATFRAK
jgi:hypothetical protein